MIGGVCLGCNNLCGPEFQKIVGCHKKKDICIFVKCLQRELRRIIIYASTLLCTTFDKTERRYND